ncbi:Carboxylesterase [Lachnellula willkommii]|uniref:Carboxylesterase n=1 Tax=Lachnellula willkommii TaxID=215461 RepID=A0A559MB21_9HELO|nr:Carboxylesterase [Lachnellula willkommii]
MASFTKPPYDPQLWEVLKNIPQEPPLSLETLQAERDGLIAEHSPEKVLTDPAISHREVNIPGPGGELMVSILEAKDSTRTNRPGIYYIHGGCFIFGTRLTWIKPCFEWIKQCDAVLVTVEYRLAPEHPDPAPIEDCYAGLKWFSETASKLGVNPDQILLAGFSAGGALAAGIALMARDRNGPKTCAMCLIAPMLDDQKTTISTSQFLTEGALPGETNAIAWSWLLQGRTGEDVSIYAAPARAKDLSGLPDTWVDVGSAEVFRDECVAFAGKIWEAGGGCELHVWRGAWHGFDVGVPDANVTKTALETRLGWIKRVLGVEV